jgi:hypothetical protein
MAKELQQAKTYTVSSAPTEPLELAAETARPVRLHRRSRRRENRAQQTGKISVRRMMQEDALKDFIGGDNKMAEWVVRQHGIPQAIFVDDGYMNLKDWRKSCPSSTSAKPRRACTWRSCRSWSGARASSKSTADPGAAPVPRGRFVPGQRRPVVRA